MATPEAADEVGTVRAVKSLLRRTTEMADALTALHGDLSYGPMHKDWPAFLDAVQPLLVLAQALMREVATNSGFDFSSRLLTPSELSIEPDERLAAATQGRMHIFAPDLVPELLRTKPEPGVAEMKSSLQAEADSAPEGGRPEAVQAAVKQHNARAAEAHAKFMALRPAQPMQGLKSGSERHPRVLFEARKQTTQLMASTEHGAKAKQ